MREVPWLLEERVSHFAQHLGVRGQASSNGSGATRRGGQRSPGAMSPVS
jgi:hypothetical protein